MDSQHIVSDAAGGSDAAPFREPRDRRLTLGAVGRRRRRTRCRGRDCTDGAPRMTHEDAMDIVEAMDITGAAHGAVHGDFDRVRTALTDHARAITALNSLEPAKGKETPQGAAAHRGCREVLQFMVSRGVTPDVFIMAALGMTDDLRSVLRRAPHLANSQGAHGIHALNHSIDRATTDLLLHFGADPNYPVYEPWNWTPVHEAAAGDRVDTLSALAEYGGRIDGAQHCTTALHAAARNGSVRAVRWLLANGAAADPVGAGGPYEGRTPRETAAEYGRDAVLAALDAAAHPMSPVARPLPVIRAASPS